MFLANLLIALREGLEAALVVSIIVAYLVKSDRRDALPKLWLGVGLAALVPLVAGAIMTWGPKTLTFQAQEILGGLLSFVAVGLVTWMIFWMGKNARELKGELEGSLSKTLAEGGSGWGVVWIAVVAVGREGVETALFVWATVRSSIETSIMQTTAGVVTGLVLAIVLGVLIYQGAVRINLRIFFAVTGYFLIVVAAGIVAYGIGDLQEAGLLPGHTSHAWDLSSYLPANTSPLHWLYVLLEASPPCCRCWAGASTSCRPSCCSPSRSWGGGPRRARRTTSRRSTPARTPPSTPSRPPDRLHRP